MQSLAVQMSIYQSHHTKEITKITHYFGVPCIILGIQIFLSWFHISFADVFHISLAWLAVIAITVYYLLLDVSLAIATTLILCILTLIAQLLAKNTLHFWGVFACLIFFIGGWIMQFVGHYFEGKKPAFMDSIWQMLVAPIFLVAEAFFALGLKKKLQLSIASLIQ